MATLRQIEANRLNAQKSTGPRTEEGKAKSSLNHLRHGMRARTLVLPEENQDDFDAEYQDLLDHFQPEGPVEHHLVEQMAVSRWKLFRADRFVEATAADARESHKGDPGKVMKALSLGEYYYRALIWVDHMEDRCDRAYLRAERRLSQLQKERRKQEQEQTERSNPISLPPRPVEVAPEPAAVAPEPVAVAPEPSPTPEPVAQIAPVAGRQISPIPLIPHIPGLNV